MGRFPATLVQLTIEISLQGFAWLEMWTVTDAAEYWTFAKVQQ